MAVWSKWNYILSPSETQTSRNISSLLQPDVATSSNYAKEELPDKLHLALKHFKSRFICTAYEIQKAPIKNDLNLLWNQGNPEISFLKWELWLVIITSVPAVEKAGQSLTHLTNAAPSISSKETWLCIHDPEHAADWRTNKCPSCYRWAAE